MMKVTCKQKGHKKKKRPSGCESPASSVAHLISALFFGIPCKISLYALQNNPFFGGKRWCSQQPQSNLITVPLSVHGNHCAARGCSDIVKESWIQLQER
ncbi:hypothetical protein E2C01_028442 [Portunus trituberculatus]|uniref:Uncharacterized protein n=1 Tax=Portunus trituberculatus TaxID=210409 RepID=A0A5B7EQ12_PORTR|nr:hypothetical protein [Portunus trituberculatus]